MGTLQIDRSSAADGAFFTVLRMQVSRPSIFITSHTRSGADSKINLEHTLMRKRLFWLHFVIAGQAALRGERFVSLEQRPFFTAYIFSI